ncbi:MAG TPA: VIT domain-containing protein, partial [Gemmatimonadales bacterium]|nr:VIT domain-containing protein [Gemmatimonadales bacterium]
MRMSHVLGAAALLCIISSSLLAQGWIDPIRPIIPPPQNPNGRIERLRSAVQVSVTGRVARVTVEEWFRNNGPVMDEGMYHFPLPGEAVFSSYSLWQGDQELRGEAMDAAQARAIYEAIVRQKRDPALIELEGQGLIRARVFPIAPGETRKITLKYTQLLDRAGDAWRFRYLGDRNRQSAPRSFRLEVDSAARFGDPFSPTHAVQVTRHDNRLEVTLGDNAAGGDFELLLPLARGLIGLSLVPHHPVGEDGYFMLLLAPGRTAQTVTLHRDVVAVLDVSGSMSGEKLDQAKAALVQLLGTLRAEDRFRLITFSSDVRRYAPAWTEGSTEHIRDAQQWVRTISAGGGTNIAGALAEAFATSPAEGALGVVVFLTDGMPTVGETDPERIADQADRGRGAFRVIAFGIGYDVNTYVLERLTERARGVAEYIRPGGDIEQAVSALAAKISSPVLTDLALRADGVELYDLQPQGLPDLFADDELVVFGRYRGAGGGERSVTITGRRGGHEERFTTDASFSGDAGARGYIQQLWAAREAGALSRDIRLHGPNPEILSELKRLALRYGILTDYTSYLVQEPPTVAFGQMPVPLGAVTVTAAPRDQTGDRAVRRAERDSKLMRSEVVVEADSSVAAPAARTGATQRVGARLFVLRDSVWTDTRHGDSLRVVRVAPFSDAYFALLRALP